MERTNKIQRSEMWKQIYKIVKQIPRKEIEGDAMDAPSAATEIEKYFLKTCNKPQVINSVDVERKDSVCQYKNVCKNDFVNDKCLADTEQECDCLILAN